MQLVIDIPDNYDLSKIQNGSVASKIVLNAVANGTPLPKGHGKLIAEPTEEIIRKLKDARNKYPTTYSSKVYDAVTIDEGIAEVTDFGIGKGLEMAILIIEANKGRK